MMLAPIAQRGPDLGILWFIIAVCVLAAVCFVLMCTNELEKRK